MEVNKQPTANSQQHIALLMNEVAKGGVTSVIKNTLIRLHQLGVQITLCAKKLDEEAISRAYLRDFNANVIILPEKLENAAPKLIDYINKESISLVICLGLWDIHYLATAVREHTSAKIANWLHMMPFYNKNLDRSKAYSSTVAFIKYYFIKLPLVYTLGFKDPLKETNRHILNVYDYFLVLCQEYKNELIEKLNLDNTLAYKIVPLINTIEINPSPKLQKEKEIAYIGRLHNEDKRLTDLLRVWQRIAHKLPEWTLRLYGSGIDEDFIKSFAQKRNLPRVEFMGYTNDVQSVYDRTAIICLTSVIEGWPMMLIEAQNNGVIPISYNCAAGIKSIIGKEAGILIDDSNISDFANALYTLTQDENKQKQLQKACLEKRLDYAPEINDETWCKLIGL